MGRHQTYRRYKNVDSDVKLAPVDEVWVVNVPLYDVSLRGLLVRIGLSLILTLQR